MNKKIILGWGETPFEHMSREDLLLESRRMYSALRSLYSALKLCQYGQEGNPFFGPEGTAGQALEKGRQSLDSIDDRVEGGSDDIYRSFYRYAVDLLFDRSTGFRIGSGWSVCPICGLMVGENQHGESVSGRTCSEVAPQTKPENCPGIFRPLAWEDLDPNNSINAKLDP